MAFRCGERPSASRFRVLAAYSPVSRETPAFPLLPVYPREVSMCPSASQPRKNQPGKDQFPKSQSQKSQQPEPAQSYDPSSFSDTFRAMARESLVKNQKNRPDSPIVSISPVLIVLGAIAAALYGGLWQSWACLIPLVLILVLMWVRYTMQRQALNDFAELEAARTAWKKTRNRQYLELMAAQSARILDENKALTKQARAHVQEYADFAAQKLGAQR